MSMKIKCILASTMLIATFAAAHAQQPRTPEGDYVPQDRGYGSYEGGYGGYSSGGYGSYGGGYGNYGSGGYGGYGYSAPYGTGPGYNYGYGGYGYGRGYGGSPSYYGRY